MCLTWGRSHYVLVQIRMTHRSKCFVIHWSHNWWCTSLLNTIPALPTFSSTITQCYQLQIGEEGSYSSQCRVRGLPKVFCWPHQGDTGPGATRMGTIFQRCYIRDSHEWGECGGAVWCAEKDEATQCGQRSNCCWPGQVPETPPSARKATTTKRFVMF